MQKGIKRAVRVGGIYYRVYKHRGEIMVSRGVINPNGNFEPFNESSPWLTQNPSYTMTLESGKVLCEIENDIPEAIEMVKNCGHESVKKGTNKKLVKHPSIVKYEFSTTETEFNVIKHAVAKLKWTLDWRLNPDNKYRAQTLITNEERWAMETERAAARELIFRLNAVEGD